MELSLLVQDARGQLADGHRAFAGLDRRAARIRLDCNCRSGRSIPDMKNRAGSRRANPQPAAGIIPDKIRARGQHVLGARARVVAGPTEDAGTVRRHAEAGYVGSSASSGRTHVGGHDRARAIAPKSSRKI